MTPQQEVTNLNREIQRQRQGFEAALRITPLPHDTKTSIDVHKENLDRATDSLVRYASQLANQPPVKEGPQHIIDSLNSKKDENYRLRAALGYTDHEQLPPGDLKPKMMLTAGTEEPEEPQAAETTVEAATVTS